MRLSEESCVHARALKARVLEERRQLIRVGIDRAIAECHDELIEVDGRLPCLHGIRLRTGCICCIDESLRDRERWGRLIVASAARDERDRGHSNKE